MDNNSTLTYYNFYAKALIDKYDNVDMSQLHKLFEKYIDVNDVVLDIGFGSGRDLKKIYSITPNTFGLDACDEFITNLIDTDLENNVAKTILPEIDILKLQVKQNKFDVIVSIAVLMHLNIVDLEITIRNMKSILIENGILIVSYSLKREVKDERYFENLTKELMLKLFEKHGYKEIDSYSNSDGMNREIQWVTQILQVQ